MRSLISHFRYTLRLLAKSPGFTLTAILILGFGIGTNTAIFSLIDAVLLKPLPYPSPERLMIVSQETPNSPLAWVDYPDYQDFCRSQRSFEDLGVMREWHFDRPDDWNDNGVTAGPLYSEFFVRSFRRRPDNVGSRSPDSSLSRRYRLPPTSLARHPS